MAQKLVSQWAYPSNQKFYASYASASTRVVTEYQHDLHLCRFNRRWLLHFRGKRWRPRPKNDSYKPKSNCSASGANANDDAARWWRLETLLTLHLHGPNNRKANYFPSMPLSGNLKVGVCKMPSADISSISRIPRHCYLLMLSVICIISMWQMGTAHSFPRKMNWAFKGA